MDDNYEHTTTSRTLSILNLIFGAWLIISPYLLSYNSGQARWEQTIAGIVVAILALVRLGAPRQAWASWVNGLIGVWMIIAPYATNYQSTNAMWNEVIFGILIAIVGFSNAMTHTAGQHHGSGAHHAT